MSDRLSQANRILDRTCKKAGLDPVEVRLAMIQTLQAKLANGKGFSRMPPAQVTTDGETTLINGKPVKPICGATFT